MYLNWNSVLEIFQNYICGPLLPENFLKVKPQQLIGGIPLCLSDLLEFASRICLIRCVWNDPSALILLPMTLWNLNISLLDLSFQFDSDNLNLFWRLFCWMGWLLFPTLYRPRNVLQSEKAKLRKGYNYGNQCSQLDLIGEKSKCSKTSNCYIIFFPKLHILKTFSSKLDTTTETIKTRQAQYTFWNLPISWDRRFIAKKIRMYKKVIIVVGM